MACLDENMLVAFFTPGRSPAVGAQVEAHTAECKACRSLLAQYAEMSASSGTSQTHANEDCEPFPSAAVPSLTPGVARVDGIERAYPLPQAQAAKRIGTLLKGKWRIEGLLGFGGMAYVFAARHRNGRRVAIKCMRHELMTERSLIERFLREGYVANKIQHPGAVAILDDDVMDDGTPFLVMELLTGKTLRQRLEDGPLGLHEALAIIADVLDVLAVAHDKDIVHRDLKPDNLFQTEDGSIKVLDFGIARLKERSRSEYETQSGTTMGTVGFMPPEQARGLTAEVDARSDVWAIGATLFTLLTGRSLHEARTPNEALLLAMTVPVAPMAEELPWLPSSVQALLDGSLAFTNGERYASARAMKRALDAALAGLEGAAVVSRPLSLSRKAAPPTEIAPANVSESLVARAFARRGASPRSDSKVTWAALAGAVALLILLTAGVAMMSAGGAKPGFPPAALPEPPALASAEAPVSPSQELASASAVPPPMQSSKPAAVMASKPPSRSASPQPSAARLPKAASPPLAPPSSEVDVRDPLGLRH